MTDERPGAAALRWWSANLRPDLDSGPVRGFRARLRRADGPLDILSEPRVIALHEALGARPDPLVLAALAQVLAAVERHEPRRIARAFGGDPPALSPLRFQRLIRAKDRADLSLALRRALPLVGNACNVAALAQDVLRWREEDRIRWCFDYFGKAPPTDAPAATPDLETTE